MDIKQFDKTNLNILRKEIDAALANVAKKHQIALSIGAISYSGEQFHTKLQAVVQSKDNKGLTVKQIQVIKNVKMYGNMYNITEEDLNKTFTYAGKPYKFVGLMPSRPKYPVLGESSTGKVFKFSEEVLTRLAYGDIHG
jgi:hypothetical protein